MELRKITHRDMVKLKDGRIATVYDTGNKILIRIRGEQYKSLSEFHTVKMEDIKEVMEMPFGSDTHKEWV